MLTEYGFNPCRVLGSNISAPWFFPKPVPLAGQTREVIISLRLLPFSCSWRLETSTQRHEFCVTNRFLLVSNLSDVSPCVTSSSVSRQKSNAQWCQPLCNGTSITEQPGILVKNNTASKMRVSHLALLLSLYLYGANTFSLVPPATSSLLSTKKSLLLLHKKRQVGPLFSSNANNNQNSQDDDPQGGPMFSEYTNRAPGVGGVAGYSQNGGGGTDNVNGQRYNNNRQPSTPNQPSNANRMFTKYREAGPAIGGVAQYENAANNYRINNQNNNNRQDRQETKPYVSPRTNDNNKRQPNNDAATDGGGGRMFQEYRERGRAVGGVAAYDNAAGNNRKRDEYNNRRNPDYNTNGNYNGASSSRNNNNNNRNTNVNSRSSNSNNNRREKDQS